MTLLTKHGLLAAAVFAVSLGASSAARAITPQVDATCSPIPSLKRFLTLSRVDADLENTAERTYNVYWPIESDDLVATQLQPELGGEFLVVRCQPPGRWAVVGKGEISNVNGKLIVARAMAPEQSQSELGNQYLRPMVGDVVLPKHVSLEPIARIFPKFEFHAAKLFDRDESLRMTYNLSDAGKRALRESFSKLRSSSGRIVVESFINREGSRELLRMESQIRATTVAQFIAREFTVGEDKISAIGMGSEGLEGGMAVMPRWPKKEILEGIVLRVVPR